MGERHVALVTGGGGGIGAAICQALADAGAFVLVAGRNQARTITVAERLRAAGADAAALTLDVTDHVSIAKGVSGAVRLAGAPVDWLVNNAGLAVSAPVVDADRERDIFRQHMDVNFHGARVLAEAVLPTMIDRGYGRIVQIASSAALRGYSYVSAYAASKHALLGYTRSAAHELAAKGVAFNAICPHYVDSPMTDASVTRIVSQTGRGEDETRALLTAQNPGGVLVTPEEVGSATCELVLGDTTGVVVELVGGDRRVVEAGWTL